MTFRHSYNPSAQQPTATEVQQPLTRDSLHETVSAFSYRTPRFERELHGRYDFERHPPHRKSPRRCRIW